MTMLTAYRTPPQRETAAADDARAAGLRAYVPRVTVVVRRSGHAKGRTARTVPAAPGYVFANGRPLDERRAQHFRQVVGAVTRDDLSAFYQSTRSLAAGLRARPVPVTFRPADRVRITAGPFEGKTGTIAANRTKKLCMVTIDGRQIAVPVRLLEKQ